ncbi:hypothetical protein MNBD_GAMMA25-1919 [hydrothermal vent metagenome]|uniref:TonB-dependent receptor n=1 Tax=hydrothermal vent metagenome TaxID=652676 RepID=A0A3B1AKY7_9ZZZZ
MRKHGGYRHGLIGLIILLAGSPPSPATELSEDDFLQELPIVLSATRLVQDKRDAPVATTVIDREMIDASGFTEISDLLRYVPGFMVNYDSGHFPVASYRMLNNKLARRMQVLVDGRSVYTPSTLGVQWNSLGITIEDIERIEVIRGPNAASYGSNSLLGAISIITRHASQDKGLMTRVNVGNNNLAETYVRAGGGSENFDARVTAAYRQNDGFSQRYDSAQFRQINARADYQASDNDTLVFNAGMNNGKVQEDNTFDSAIPKYPSYVYTRSFQVGWTHSFSASEDFKFQFYRQSFEKQNRYDYAETGMYLDEGHRSERDDIEFLHTLAPLDNLNMAWGAGIRNDKVISAFHLGSQEPVGTNKIYRVFSNLAWNITDSTLLNAGLMLEDYEISNTELSPMLSLNHHLTNTDTLRVSASTAIRSPGLLEEFTNVQVFGTPIVYDAGTLEPERINAYEIGYLGRFPRYGASLDLKLYRENIRNLITLAAADSEGNLPYHFANLDNAKTRGFEATLGLSPNQKFRMALSYSYARIEATDVRNTTQYSNSSPDNSFSLQIIQRFPHDFQGSLNVFYNSTMKQLETEDMRARNTRVNFRLGKTFTFSGNQAEFAVVVLNLLNEFEDTRLKNVSERRSYLSLKLEFR